MVLEAFPDILYREVLKNSVSILGKTPEGFEANSWAIINDSDLGRVGLVRKWTQYVNHPGDVMVVPLDSQVSQITEFQSAHLEAFLHLCGLISNAIHHHLGKGFQVVAINQQPECVNIPDKFSNDGTELKVQTINTIHAHLFVEDETGQYKMSPRKLKPVDRYSFIDPFGMVCSELIYNQIGVMIASLPGFVGSGLFINKYPLGINIRLAGGVEQNLDKPEVCTFLVDTQNLVVDVYGFLETQLRAGGKVLSRQEKTEIVRQFLEKYPLRARNAKYLSRIITTMKDYSDVDAKYLRLVQGPAMTWIIYEKDGNTFINLTPRILSRGNASEALGVWVNPVDASEGDSDEINYRKEYWKEVTQKLSERLDIKPGPASHEI